MKYINHKSNNNKIKELNTNVEMIIYIYIKYEKNGLSYASFITKDL